MDELSPTSPQPPKPLWLSFVVATLAVLVAAVLTSLIPDIGSRTPFAFFYGAVALVGWTQGWRAGIWSVVLSTIIVDYLYFEPKFAFAHDATSFLVLFTFVCISSLICFIATSRQAAAQALETQRDRNSNILQQLRDSYFSIDKDWRLTSYNKKANSISVVPMQDLLGQHLLDAYPMLRGTAMEEHYRRAMQERQPLHFQTASVYSDKWFEVDVYPTDDGGLSVFARDITEQRRAQLAERTTAERLKIAMQAGDIGDWDWTIATDAVTFSPRVREIFGMTPDEPVTFASVQNVVHPDDVPILVEGVQHAVRESGEQNLEYRVLHPDGSVHWVLARGRVLKDENGQPEQMVGVAVDITENKQREEERRILEQRFQIMADSAPVLVWMSGPDKQATWFNKPWLEWTGRTSEQETGNGWMIGIHPSDLARSIDTYTTAFDARETFSMEYRLRHHSGEHRWVLNNGRPLFNASGEFTGYIGSCTDIEEMKRAEAERDRLLANERAARSEAERISRMKDEFLATLSHELRTPLNAIIGWANLLRTGAISGEEEGQALQIIERNARVQAQLVEDLLDMSRIISGKLRLDVQRLELPSIIQAAIEAVQPAAEAKEIRLQRVLDPNAGLVMGDPNRLQQVVWNLLANAIKFTPKGGRVQIVLKRVNSHLEIVVSDSGIGISPLFLPHVFDRFRQADSSNTREYGGLGLGLGIVRNLVELHGGSVTAESGGEGAGSTFIVSLPIAPVRSIPAGLNDGTPSITLETKPPQLQGLHVLVVDDEVDSRFLVQRILESSNARVHSVGSAEEALNYIREHTPDLLISDIGMPGEDGYSLIQRVRHLPPSQGGDTRAVALTALARSEDRRRALLAGFQMHLPKPVDPSELLAVVANVSGLLTPARKADDETSSASE